jgi:hypothetical protein
MSNDTSYRALWFPGATCSYCISNLYITIFFNNSTSYSDSHHKSRTVDGLEGFDLIFRFITCENL